MKREIVCVFLCIWCILYHPGNAEEIKKMVEGNGIFALNLYKKTREKQKNLLLSPYSISSVLAMTYAGSKSNTEKQMAEVLHFNVPQKEIPDCFFRLKTSLSDNQQTNSFSLQLAHSLWAHKESNILQHYKSLMENAFGSTIERVDFVNNTENVRKEINHWVEQKTESFIKNLIPEHELSPATRFVLVNAIYFFGTWEKKFDPEMTSSIPFWKESKESVDLSMMNQTDNFMYGENSEAKILELPYEGDGLAMVIILPHKRTGLWKLEKKLTSDKIRQWIDNLSYENVDLSLPKFELNVPMNLTNHLKEMGMTDAFTPGKADFSGIDGTKSLFVSNVLHQAMIKIDERGTKAAAATAVMMTYGSAPTETKTFLADHPFLFLIHDKNNGSILFIGRLSKPT